jgi:ketosteroid isomerase-like protein
MTAETPGLGALLRNDADPVDDPVARRAGKDAVKRFFKAVAAGDMTALGEAVTDDVVYQLPFSESGSTEPGHFRHFSGRAEVVAFLA